MYRTSKQAAERLLDDLSSHMGLSLSTILRYGSIYGPRVDANNAIRIMDTQALDDRRIDFWGAGSEMGQDIHVRDAAELSVLALDEVYVGRALHILGRERIVTMQVMEMVSELLGGDIEISLRDEPFGGRYRLTPYTFEVPNGLDWTPTTYVDLGLGIFEDLANAQYQAAHSESALSTYETSWKPLRDAPVGTAFRDYPRRSFNQQYIFTCIACTGDRVDSGAGLHGPTLIDSM